VTARVLRFAVAVLLAALAASALMQTAATPPEAVTKYLPKGALLVLETGNFESLLGEWNTSSLRTDWFASDNHRALAQSKLYLRLNEARDELAAAASFEPDWSLLDAVAGGDSALAVYDIGELQFLYITRLPEARALETLLWSSRARFEPRRAGERDYYVRRDEDSGREVAFAAADGTLLLATAERQLAAALELFASPDSGEDSGSVENEPWRREALAEASERGEVRLSYNLRGLLATAHFRSYWIQRNASRLAEWSSGVSDLRRNESAWREERILVRAEAAEAPAQADLVLGRLLALVPPDAGLHRAWASPETGQTLELLRRKLFDPKPTGYPAYLGSPMQAATGPALETRIDAAPPPPETASFRPTPWLSLFAANAPRGLLHVESAYRAPGALLESSSTLIAVLGESEWDEAAVRNTASESVAELWTVSGLGLGWSQTGASWRLDGLADVSVAIRGRLLLVSQSPELINQVVARSAAEPPAQPLVYSAGFRRSREHEPYRRLMSALDFLQGGGRVPANQRAPMLFSENLTSISATLSAVDSIEIARRDRGATVEETATYRLAD